MKHTISYAQNREDIIINAFFNDKMQGFYVDVGANHPTQDSVTKLFYDKGWRGVNFEPNTSLLALLRADRPEDVNIGKGIGDTVKIAIFREYLTSHSLSTFSPYVINDKSKNPYLDDLKKEHRDHKLELSTLALELGRQGVKAIDFMKVDVEGLEYEVLAGNDWEKYRPELLCIASNRMVKDWRPLLEGAGYIKFFFDGLNDYYAIKESSYLKQFSYPEKVLMRYPRVDYFSSNSDKTIVSEETYKEVPKKIKLKVSVKLQFKWSLNGLRTAVLEGFVIAIIRQKRGGLQKRIERSLSTSGDIQPMYINKKYYSGKLFLLRLGNISFSLLLKIGNKIIRFA